MTFLVLNIHACMLQLKKKVVQSAYSFCLSTCSFCLVHLMLPEVWQQDVTGPQALEKVFKVGLHTCRGCAKPFIGSRKIFDLTFIFISAFSHFNFVFIMHQTLREYYILFVNKSVCLGHMLLFLKGCITKRILRLLLPFIQDSYLGYLYPRS